MTRLACIVVPLFPLAARLRSEPDLKGETVAVFEGNGNAARVVAASRPARRIGIEPGMTLPQARSLIGKLVARARDRESERAAQETLLEIADSFSPRVEDGGEGTTYLDLDGIPAFGCGGRFATSSRESSKREPDASASSSFIGARGCDGRTHMSRPSAAATADDARYVPARQNFHSAELSFGRDLIAAVENAGLPARVGIGGSKLAARIAASLPDSPTIVAPGEEAAFLAPLSLERLAPEMETAATLARWGLRSIGDLARLPEGEVASRLGEIGRELHATARGIDPRPLEPRVPALCLAEGMDLEWPLVNLEPFLFLGNAALERLVARLDSLALACTRLEIALKLDPDGFDARGIDLPAPTRDVKTLLTLVRLELEARAPGAPVVGFTFTARPDKPRRSQLALFGPPALSPDRLATTIARLASLLGADRVGSPRTVEGHRPERFTHVSYTPPPPPAVARPPRTGRGLLAVRVLRPAAELEVLTMSPSTDAVGAGLAPARPVSLKSSPSEDTHLEIAGTVKVAAGPWSLQDGWWTESPADRDYWDVELSDGGLYRIYRERATGAWYADGIYD